MVSYLTGPTPNRLQTASVVVWVTMPLPFILLTILMIRALTLDGADIGIAAYLGNWDMSLLSDPGCVAARMRAAACVPSGRQHQIGLFVAYNITLLCADERYPVAQCTHRAHTHAHAAYRPVT